MEPIRKEKYKIKDWKNLSETQKIELIELLKSRHVKSFVPPPAVCLTKDEKPIAAIIYGLNPKTNEMELFTIATTASYRIVKDFVKRYRKTPMDVLFKFFITKLKNEKINSFGGFFLGEGAKFIKKKEKEGLIVKNLFTKAYDIPIKKVEKPYGRPQRFRMLPNF